MRSRNLLACLAAPLVLALLSSTPAAGQVYFRGTVSAVGSSVGQGEQVALDHQGNLWAVSYAGSVLKWSGTSWTVVISGLASPNGLAFDSADNLYVTQFSGGSGAVYKYPAPGYASGTALAPSFLLPFYLTFDSNNNLFVSDPAGNAIYQLSPPYSSKTAVVSSGLDDPTGIALDPSGNLFVADTLNGDVKEYTAASSYASETTIATGLNYPEGIAVDPGGNIYVSDTTGNLHLIPPANNYASIQTIYTNTSGHTSNGIAVGPGGVVYESDFHGNLVLALTPGSVNMGTSNVGATPLTTTVTFVFGGSETGVHSNVLTTGETNHDFTIDSSSPGTCGGSSASNSFSSNQTCTVNVNFAATAPGLRTGAVELLDGSNNILATGYIYGTGVAPLAAFSPAAVTPVSMGSLSPALSAPLNPAWRADGKLFFIDGGSTGRLIQIAPGSGSPTVVPTGSHTLSQPTGVVIDGAGNLYVSESSGQSASAVLKIPPSGGPSEFTTTGFPGQISMDAAGSVYVAHFNPAEIYVLPPNGNSYYLPGSTTLTQPSGVAVDGNFNVYVSDSATNHIYKISNGIATAIDTSALSTALSNPSSLTLDANGTLYVSDTGNNRIVVIPASGSPYVLPYTYTTPLNDPVGVTFDPAGHMYIADTGNHAIREYDWTSAGYQFANTYVGSTSSDSPVSYTFFNLGNADLTMAIPSSGNNPSISNSAFSLGSGTTCPELTTSSSSAATLAPLASCLLTFNFQPTAASSTNGNVTYTNNSLNVTGTSSTVALFGTGTAPPGDTTHVTFATLPSSLYSGQSATVSVTVADTTNSSTIPTGSVSFNDSIQGSLGSATINGSGVASLGSITFTGAGTHTITASYAGVSGSFIASSNTASINLSNAPAATLSTPAPSLSVGPIALGQTSSTQTVTFTFSTTGVIGQPQVLTLGASGNTQPFRSVSGGTCLNYGSTNVWTASSTCTMLVQFAPASPGLALGAIVMVDLNGNVLSTAYLNGIGTGPQAATLPGTVHTVTATGSYPSVQGMTFDGSGNLYFADYLGNHVYKVPSGGGAATLVAGTGSAGSTGDGGAATSAELNEPSDVAVDGAGNVYIADFGDNRIRMVSAATGLISTVAGNGTQGYSGDSGAATSAELNGPTSLTLDGSGNLYIVDQNNDVVRKVTAATGIITTVAGTGTAGFSGDGGPAAQAKLNRPFGVAVDGAGNLYIADKNNKRIRMVSASSGNISTVAGNGNADSGDGGLATQAGIGTPLAVAVDAAGNLTILDNTVVRVVFAASGIIETDAVNVGHPYTLREDGAGNLYTADSVSKRLYVVSPTSSFTYATGTAVGSSDSTDGPQTALLFNTGNAALTAVTPGLTAPADFAHVAGSGTPADCTASFSLASGAACTLALEFEPSTVGSLGESFTITDNSLNSSSTTQLIALAGTALAAQATLTVTGVPNAPQPYQAAFTVSSAGGSGTGAVTFQASGACTLSGTTVTITAGSGACSITATKAGDGTYGPTTSAAATVSAALATQATLTATGVPNTPQPYGATFTVSSSGGSGSGQVTFNASGACSVSGATVTLTSGTGACSVTATKAADQNYASATSTAATVAAALATQATLTVTGVPDTPRAYGATFTVATAGGSGTGQVTFNASGPCSISGTTVTITSGSGACSVTATKASDGNYASATSSAATVTAALATQTTLSVTGVPQAAQLDGATFTVGSSGGSGTGLVTFNASGACSVSGATVTMTASSGVCSVTATKASDGNYASTTSAAATVAALEEQTTLTVTGVPQTAQPYGTTFTIGSAGGSGSGLVTFNASGACSLSGTTVTITNGSGTCSVTAAKASDGTYAAATSAAATVAAALATEAALTVTGVPSTAQPYGTTFTVGSSGGSGTGGVTFTASGSCSLSGTTVTITNGSGACSVTATKAADADYTSATSMAATVPAALASQTIHFTAPASPVTFSAAPITLAASGGDSGNAVTFTVTGPATLSGSTLTLTGGGTVTITAHQAGNGDYQAAAAVTHTIVVDQASATIALTASADDVLITNAVTFTAKVSSTLATPAGSVNFYDGSTLLGTVTITGEQSALRLRGTRRHTAAASNVSVSFTTSSLAAGTHAISAVYSGDSSLSAVTSEPLAEVVQDFTLSMPTTAGSGGSGSSASSSPPSQTVLPGGTANYTLALGPTHGTTFPVPVTLSVSGLPPGATATLNPTVLPAGAPLTSVTLSIQLPQPTASLPPNASPHRGAPPALWCVLLLPFAGRLRRAGKKLNRKLCLLLMLAAGLAATLLLNGCGSGNGFFGQQEGTYTVTLTATAGAVAHSTNVMLTVE